MIHHATNTGGKNIILDKEAQGYVENLDQMGECPIISYQHIQGLTGLNEKQEFNKLLRYTKTTHCMLTQMI